jgi:omega-6 fatty acid desaturase (delta-12 desaturase)
MHLPQSIAPGPDVSEVRSHIAPGRRVRLMSGVLSFVVPAAAWAATLAGVILLPWWWAQLPLGLLNGFLVGVLFIVGHDAGHGILTPHRWLNRLLGRLCLLPALHPYTAWVHNHNGLHHAFTNWKERDPGFPPLSVDEYRRRSAWGRWVYRRQRTWYGLGLLYFLDMWVKWEMFPTAERAPRNPKAYFWDRLWVTLFAVAWVGGLVVAGWGDWLNTLLLVLFGFVVPQMAWNWLIGFIILQQHTHPRIAWYSDQVSGGPSYFQMQVRATPHITFPLPFRWLMRHVMEHTAHHADPGVPLYHLPDAQRELEKKYRADIVRVLWGPREFLRTMRVCKVYDYHAHRWCDYDGTPLTPVLIAMEEEAVEAKLAG